MKLYFFTEARFIKFESRYYSSESSFSYNLFMRYLEYFDEIIICARTLHTNAQEEIILNNRVDLEGVSIKEIPYYVGFWGFIKSYFKVNRVVKSVISNIKGPGEAILCRLPGRIGTFAINASKKRGIKYSVEVVGDPYDVLSNGATSEPLAPFIRYFSYRSLKKSVIDSHAVLYVTEEALQRRYPNNHYNVGVSDVVMPSQAFVNRKDIEPTDLLRIVCVGSLDQMYKAPDVMIKALSLVLAQDHNIALDWVGAGKFQPTMQQLAKDLGVQKNIKFHGKLPGGEAVREVLDRADLFVIPSRMEGLPRALVEAMARGLPCLGTNISGISELLEEDCLLVVNDVLGLAKRILEVKGDIKWRREQARLNLSKAQRFQDSVLKPKRDEFYSRVKTLNLIG